VFVNVSGGLKITERACDLAVAAAIISSYKNTALDTKTALFGEVGLLGEVRHVGQEERREKEARRLGFTTVLASKTTKNLGQLQKLLQ
jgi:DNA repair protein RadA/Sms